MAAQPSTWVAPCGNLLLGSTSTGVFLLGLTTFSVPQPTPPSEIILTLIITLLITPISLYSHKHPIKPTYIFWNLCSYICLSIVSITTVVHLIYNYYEVSIFCSSQTYHSTLILSLIHISEPTRLLSISYAVFCLKK